MDTEGDFSGEGTCSPEFGGEFASVEAQFTGSFSENGDATGEVFLSSGSGLGTGSYDLNGSIDDSDIEFDWYVEALRFDGSFTTD